MNIEIERRFIVRSEEWKKFINSSQEFKQGYLVSKKDSWTIRIRIIDEKEALITLKYPKERISRYEFEYEVPIEDGYSIWNLAEFKISKTRYQLRLNDHTWIVDSFKEQNSPLVLAEIELNTIEEKIDIPQWCSSEISDAKEFSNASLAKSPISSWPIEKRRSIL
ncbi:CYTH domain-containing protein [Prochlorococcus sp. MIT 1223]|uniref:CYTH domain-containing protein n=1 Tax=Prochlorococcus sp. MIT 1223 TaxID=3096217 RepID=UPI002A753152|nr:CYTH domain-containing protein [Prochlorococcus sp. MIT 1223]